MSEIIRDKFGDEIRVGDVLNSNDGCGPLEARVESIDNESVSLVLLDAKKPKRWSLKVKFFPSSGWVVRKVAPRAFPKIRGGVIAGFRRGDRVKQIRAGTVVGFARSGDVVSVVWDGQKASRHIPAEQLQHDEPAVAMAQ